MKIRLLEMWNGNPAGKIMDLGEGQVQLLVDRKIAVRMDDDPDGDGKAESGFAGIKKAFSSPPKQAEKRR